MGSQNTAIIIGAGPAGLTAAYELLQRTSVKPIILEQHDYMGGISRTVRYKGNRMDIGGHRFFSKSDRVMRWWVNIMPLENGAGGGQFIQYQNHTFEAVKMKDFTTGLIKSGVFGAIISSLACYLGLGVRGGAQGVGVATTRTVVLTIVALISVDLMFTAAFYFLGY